MRAPAGRGAGLLGCTYEELQWCSYYDSGDDQFAITGSICDGTCPTEVMEFMNYARLLALRKPNGTLRPLACGPVALRVAGQCYLEEKNSDTLPYFTASVLDPADAAHRPPSTPRASRSPPPRLRMKRRLLPLPSPPR